MSSVDKSHPPSQFYCQLYQTYLPPSYLPLSCRGSTETYSQWPWSLINTVFVSVTTIFNTYVFLAVVFLWMVNRQFHLSKKRHSYDKKPLRPLKKPAKALKRATVIVKDASKRSKTLKRATVIVKNASKKSKALKRATVIVKNASEKFSPRKRKGVSGKTADALGAEETPKLAEQHNYKSFPSLFDDFDEEDEEDEAIKESLAGEIQKRDSSDSRDVILSAPERRAKKKRTRDLLRLASKIEVFSYLSPEAVVDVLEYVDYVDFKNVGDVVYDTDSLDGSLYAIVTGEVTTSLSIQKKSNQAPFSFVAGPGEVITSMLSIITSLIREYQIQDALLNSLIPGVLNGRTSMGGGDSSKMVIPKGMDVKAVVSRANTQLLRIPSRCFVAILEKFPQDVHHVCQTIVARLQRVTIQTLVRFLGLDEGILGMSGQIVSPSGGVILEKKPCNVTAEWSEFEQSLLDNSGSVSSQLDQATLAAGSLLGLSAPKSDELKEGTTIMYAPPGGIICRKGEPPDAVYLILKGSLEVGMEKSSMQKSVNGGTVTHGVQGEHKKARRSRTTDPSRDGTQDQNTSFKPLFSASPGNWVGLFSCFTHDASFITVRNPEQASSGAMLLRIPVNTFENVISHHPCALIHTLLDIIDTVGDAAKLCVSPSMFLLDMSLDWMHVEAGESIAVQGETCDSMYMVLTGRLRAQTSQDNSKSPSNPEEFGRGATIGELEALAESKWTQSVYAVRHSEVARIPNQIINILTEMYPGAGIHFARVIASQIQSRKSLENQMNSLSSLLPSYALSLATIAVVSLTEEVNVSEFCSYLTNSLASIAPCQLLTKKYTKQQVGHAFFRHRNSMLKVKMTRILGDFEECNRLLVYEADSKYTWWTKLCIQQADCVLILVDSKNAPKLQTRVEACLSWANEAKNIRSELVVVQSLSAQKDSPNEEHASDNLNNWSEQRPWISKHHLIRCNFADHVQDFRRMSRRITGQSIGLVMGGGGARGLAHLGIIKALNEVGVPVDMVGGTSQGAFVGALLARSPDDYGLLAESVREMAADMSSISSKLRDLTFPLTSFFSGHHFNRGIQKVLGNARIQDFVLNFYCVSVDICNSCQVVHTQGLAWKYVRASMSLTGYLPPISENKRLLVDGGYMNVVPADVMAEMGAKKIIAVDVALEEKCDYFEYGTELSGLWLLWNSWNPFIQTVKVPSMGDINERLAWVSSERSKKDIIKNKVDLFLKPPVGHIGTLEYHKIDEIVKVGYDYARPLVEEWAKENGYT